MCPVSVSFAALLRFFCAFLSDRKASNAPARPLIRQAFQCGGVQPWTVQGRRDHPARPVHSRTGGEPPFTQPRRFCARFAKPSGHRPHLAGNANRCIRDETGRSMARVLRAGICGDDFFWGMAYGVSGGCAPESGHCQFCFRLSTECVHDKIGVEAVGCCVKGGRRLAISD